MKVAVFDTHEFERVPFQAANAKKHELTFFEARLSKNTASLASGFDVVCPFVNDKLDHETLSILKGECVQLIALRSAGFNHVDLAAAAELELPVVRVPGYSPYAVAEHATALILGLNRKTHRAYNRVREMNFSLDGLVGFDLHGKTVGILGTGRIGQAMARIMRGFGCELLGYDLMPNEVLAEELQLRYTDLIELYNRADIISLHLPLTPATHHLINAAALARMKPGVMLVNTGRGGLVDSVALIAALKGGRVGAVGLDVYEQEEGVFFSDLSDRIFQDDILARLLTFPNVLITSHQGFLTIEALTNIAETTIANIDAFAESRRLENEVSLESNWPTTVTHRDTAPAAVR